MKNIVVVLALTIGFSSCSKNTEPDVLPQTLQAIIANSEPACTCLPYINKYLWKGQKIYVLAFRGPACNWTPGYYDEEGNPFVMTTGYQFDRFLKESFFLKEIWRCE